MASPDPTLLGALPPSLELKTTPQSGRGLYARQLIQHGSELLKATPLAHVVKAEYHTTVCQACLGKYMRLLRCGACKYVHYCSRECQREDWDLHKVECAGLQRVNGRSEGVNKPTDTMRLVVRLVGMARNSPAKKLQLESLGSNEEKLSEEAKSALSIQAVGVALLLGNNDDADQSDDHANEETGGAELFGILCKVLSNTFNILDRDYDCVLGLGVYGVPSLVNHSCDASCVAVFAGKQLVLRSVLPVNPGEQVCISYCEIMDSKARRQAHLQKVYSFTCSCSRCVTEESESSPLHVMYAPKDKSVSAEKKSSAMKEGFSLLDQDLKELEKNDDWPGFVEKCCDFLGRHGDVLHPLNVVMTNVREQQMRGRLALENWEAAVDTGQLLAQAYNYCLPPFHPVHILHLIKMGKLRRVLGTTQHLRKSVEELQKALDGIPVTFGRDSPLMAEVMLMVKDSQMELTSRTRNS